MARDGLPVTVRAAMLLGSLSCSFGLVSFAPAAEGREKTITSALAVQTAMQQAREHLLHHRPQAAVQVLESELPRIDGNAAYLALLRDAYRAYIKELQLANPRGDNQELQTYLLRLSILEPENEGNKAPAPPAVSPPGLNSPGSPLGANVPRSAPLPKVRAKQEDDDPFQQQPDDGPKEARELTLRAETEFGKKNYRAAGRLYEEAYRRDGRSVEACRERWAYCKLHRVVEQMNQSESAAIPYPQLETEVRQALELSPRLDDYAKQILGEIEKRRNAAPPVTIRHGERTADGWETAETDNFRIYHRQGRELVEQTARVAERTRTAMQKKWFGVTGRQWNPRCEIYLYATKDAYRRATDAHHLAPGHSTFRLENGTISRRIDLPADNPNCLTVVLPHEATHAVLFGNFGDDKVLPRWADEGMAVLSEPREQVGWLLSEARQHRQEGRLLSLGRLVQMQEYPEANQFGAFYAQSVLLVDFLVKEKGPQIFTHFMRDGMNGDYESALQRHYGYRDLVELERHWSRAVFSGDNRSAGR